MSQQIRRSTARIVAGCLFFAFLVVAPTAVMAEWNWANPKPHGNPLRSAAYCSGTWVAVGGYGMVYTSADGIQWQQRESGATGSLYGVACNDSTIVAVGANGLVVTSTDGINWTPGLTGSERSLLDVVWDPPQGGYAGAFIGVGSQLVVLASPDGLTWSEKSTPSGDAEEHLWGVAVNGDGSLLVATGGNCYSQCEVSKMMVSDDHGDTWTTSTYIVDPYMGIVNGVTWGNPTAGAPLFVSGHDDGSVLISPNGLTWTPQATGATAGMLDVAWDGTQFVAVSFAGEVLTSPDGVTWTARTSNTDLPFYGIDAGGGMLVATGWAGTLITSGDGVTWTPRMTPSGRADPNLRLQDVAWSGTLAVAVDRSSSSTYGISPDGWSWTFRDDASGTSPAPARAIAWSPVGGTGLFVSVGRYGRIVTSPDGLTWTEQASGVSSTLYRAGWDGANLLAVGRFGLILTSGDGVTWTPETSNTSATLVGVACGGSTCVAAGNQILVTRSGGTWSATATAEVLYAIAHNGALYAAVGVGGVILTSPNGVSWTPQNSGSESSLYDVAVVHGEFIAVGSSGLILTSSDGITWSRDVSGTYNTLRGTSSGKALTVGDSGTILQRVIFADGFESGDCTAWSLEVP